MHSILSPTSATVSIHAPLTGGDNTRSCSPAHATSFQSTPPSREATYMSVAYTDPSKFQSTPPSREATRCAVA